MEMKSLLVVVAFCFSAAQAWGKCPSPAVMEDFDLQQYLGTWYEIERNYNPSESSERTCIKTKVESLNATDYNVQFTMSWNLGMLEDKLAIKGRYNAAERSAKLKVKPIPLFPKQNYWVLDTDYENYALVWSCADFVLNHYQLIWLFSRKTTLRPEHRFKAYQTLHNNGLKLEDLVVVDHSEC